MCDASKTMIKSHSPANLKRNNVVVYEIGLNQLLSIKNNSIEVYCGFLIKNIQNYPQLVKEAAITLKIGGKFTVIE